MLVVEVVLIAVVLFAVAVIATGRGGELTDFAPDRVPLELPADQLVHAGDIESVRFGLAFRGYRMDEVDEVLDRLAAEIAERDARLADLGAGVRPEDAPAHSDAPALSDAPGRRRAGPRHAAPDAPAAPVASETPATQEGSAQPGGPA